MSNSVDAKIRRGAFTRSVSKFVQTAEGRANEAVRKITFGVLSNVVLMSPVDTGRFRGNWQVGLGTRPSSPVDSNDPSGSSAIEREGAKLKDLEIGGIVYITNTLPYGRRLEFGWSAQAPAGMVRVTMKSINEIIGEAVKEAKDER